MLKLRWLSALLTVVGLWLVVPVGNAMAGPAEVRQIQQKLTDLGYDPGPVDGAWGGKTERAVRRMLGDRKIDVGIVFTQQGRDDAELLRLVSQAPNAGDGARTASRTRAAVVVQIGHSSNIQAVAYSPDGRVIATASSDENIKLWDAHTGRELRTFAGHSGEVYAVAFSPDGRFLASGGFDNTAKLWNTETGRLIRTYKGHSGSVNAIAFSPDGRHLITGAGNWDNSVRIWNVATRRVTRSFKGHAENILSVAMSPDGRLVASGGQDGKFRLWNAKTGRAIRTIEKGGYIDDIAFSPDGSLVAAAGLTNDLMLLSASDGEELAVLEGHSDVSSLAFSPDGERIVSGAREGSIEIWNVASRERVGELKGHDKEVMSVAFSPDGKQIVSGSRDTLAKLWDSETGRHIRSLTRKQSAVQSVAYAVDGKTILSGHSDGSLTLWDTEGVRLIRKLDGHSGRVVSVALAPDGRRMASGGGKQVKIWDVAAGKVIHTLKEHTDFVNSVAFSPDGKSVVSASIDQPLKLWDADTGRVIRTIAGGPDWPRSAAFSPDGQIIVSGYGHKDKSLRLWSAASGRLIRRLRGHSWTVWSGSYSPDGRTIVSAGGDKTVKLWNARTGRMIRSFSGHADVVRSARFSPDAKKVVSASGDDLAKLWDVASGRLLHTLRGHGDDVTSALFSSDGKHVLSSSDDGTIRVWATGSGELVATLIAGKNDEWLVLTPEGFFSGTQKGAELLHVVRDGEVFTIDQFYQALYRPDLVREKLAGDPDSKVREAAAKLNLDKIIDSGGVPAVAITSPIDGKTVTDDVLTVEAKFSDTGGGIGRIEWRVNGLTLGVHSKRGFERVTEDAAEAKGTTIKATQDLWLEPGKNTIEVVAYNAKNLIASEPAKITVTWGGQSSKTPPRLHVLTVGVNDYFDSRLKLNFAVPDAKAFGAALSKAGGGLYEEVSVTSVLDSDATANGLETAFKALAENVRPRDVFVFFLAGHGKTVDGRYYFIPQDFRYKNPQSIIDSGIGQDQWQRWLSNIPARKSILLYDTCESGSLTGTRIATRGMERVAALEKLTRAMGRTVLSAATDDAPALEGYRGHGVFTYALLDALNRADANNNDLIEITELAGHVDAHVPEISQTAFGQRQLPQMNIVGSNFPLAKRIAALSDRSDEPTPLSVSAKPTHVVIKASDLFAEAGGAGAISERLNPGTALTLVRTENGWTLVARDGKKIGYVPASNLARIQ